MNIWASMLADLPALGQRQIARFNRVSLSHGCDAEQRLVLLCRVLCHEATVRTTYGGLDADACVALQHLLSLRGGMSSEELERCYGGVRSWRHIASDV